MPKAFESEPLDVKPWAEYESDDGFASLSLDQKLQALDGWTDAVIQNRGAEHAQQVVSWANEVKQEYQQTELARQALEIARAEGAEDVESRVEQILTRAVDELRISKQQDDLANTGSSFDFNRPARYGGKSGRQETYPELSKRVDEIANTTFKPGTEDYEVDISEGVKVGVKQIAHPSRNIFQVTLPDGKTELVSAEDQNEALKEVIQNNKDSFSDDVGAVRDVLSRMSKGGADTFISAGEGIAAAPLDAAGKGAIAPYMLGEGQLRRFGFDNKQSELIKAQNQLTEGIYEKTKADTLRRVVEALNPVNEREAAEDFTGENNTILRQLPGALGQGAANAVLGAVTGPAAAPTLFTVNSANAGRKAAEEAIAAGRPENALSSFLLTGAATGGLETVADLTFAKGVSKIFGDVVDATKPGTIARLKQATATGTTGAIRGGIVEGSTEAVQQIVGNAVAKQFYDENRNLFEGVPEAAAVGALTGAVLGGTTGGLEGAVTFKSPDAQIGQVYRDAEGTIREVTDVRETGVDEQGIVQREVTAEPVPEPEQVQQYDGQLMPEDVTDQAYQEAFDAGDMDRVREIQEARKALEGEDGLLDSEREQQDREYEAQLLEELQGQSVTLDEAIDSIGGLISPSRAATQGAEFNQLFNESGTNQGNQRIGRFRNDGMQYDEALPMLRQYGFYFDSPSELADALYRVDQGESVTGIPAGNTPGELFSKRFEAGKALSSEDRKKVLSSVSDVYKDNGITKDEIKGYDHNGDPKFGYPYLPDLFITSDITGKKIRHYIILPDGKKAHPSELYPNISQAQIDTAILEQEALEKYKKAESEQRLKRIGETKGEANQKYTQTRRPVNYSYFAQKGNEIVRVDGIDQEDVQGYKDLGFEPISNPVPKPEKNNDLDDYDSVFSYIKGMANQGRLVPESIKKDWPEIFSTPTELNSARINPAPSQAKPTAVSGYEFNPQDPDSIRGAISQALNAGDNSAVAELGTVLLTAAAQESGRADTFTIGRTDTVPDNALLQSYNDAKPQERKLYNNVVGRFFRSKKMGDLERSPELREEMKQEAARAIEEYRTEKNLGRDFDLTARKNDVTKLINETLQNWVVNQRNEPTITPDEQSQPESGPGPRSPDNRGVDSGEHQQASKDPWAERSRSLRENRTPAPTPGTQRRLQGIQEADSAGAVTHALFDYLGDKGRKDDTQFVLDIRQAPLVILESEDLHNFPLTVEENEIAANIVLNEIMPVIGRRKLATEGAGVRGKQFHELTERLLDSQDILERYLQSLSRDPIFDQEVTLLIPPKKVKGEIQNRRKVQKGGVKLADDAKQIKEAEESLQSGIGTEAVLTKPVKLPYLPKHKKGKPKTLNQLERDFIKAKGYRYQTSGKTDIRSSRFDFRMMLAIKLGIDQELKPKFTKDINKLKFRFNLKDAAISTFPMPSFNEILAEAKKKGYTKQDVIDMANPPDSQNDQLLEHLLSPEARKERAQLNADIDQLYADIETETDPVKLAELQKKRKGAEDIRDALYPEQAVKRFDAIPAEALINPISEETVQANPAIGRFMLENKSLGDLLKWVGRNDPEYAKLARHFQKNLPKFLLKTPVGYLEPGSRGYAYATNIFVPVSEDATVKAKSVIHETLHAVTAFEVMNHFDHLNSDKWEAQLDQYIDSSLPVGEIARIYKAARQARPELKGYANPLNKDDPTSDKFTAQSDEKGINYGLSNIDEFISVAFTSKEFQDFLNSIPDKGRNQSVWRSFIKAIKRMFRIPVEKDSLLESMVIAADNVFIRKKARGQNYGGNYAKHFNVKFDEILKQEFEGATKGFFDRVNNFIGLTSKADDSTAMHEIIHATRELLKGTKHGEALNKFYNTDGDNWTRTQEEAFARHGERYFYNGQAPKGASGAVRQAFSALKRTMRKIYRTLTNSPIAEDIPAEVRQVFDELLLAGDKVVNPGQVGAFNKAAKADGNPTLASETMLNTLRNIAGETRLPFHNSSARALKERGYIKGSNRDNYELTANGTTALESAGINQAKPITELHSAQHSAAAVNRNSPARIPIEPLSGEVRPNRNVLFDVARALGKTIKYRGSAKNTYGTYTTGNSKVSIRYEGDLDTASHELGHALDDQLGIGREAQQRGINLDSELLQPAFQSTADQKADIGVKRAEGLAEFIRALIVNPDRARQEAPKTAALFDELANDRVKKGLDRFSRDIRAWEAGTAGEKIQANVQFRPDSRLKKALDLFRGVKKGNQDGFVVSAWDRIAAKWLDDKHPFIKAVNYVEESQGEKPLPANDPRILARLLQGVGSKEQDVLENGMIDSRQNRVLPGGVEWLLEPFGKQKGKQIDQDLRDTVALMIAERTVELADRFGRDDVLTGAGAGNQTDVAIAKKAISEFKQDPARYARLTEAADRYRQWADANLRYLVDKGRLSQEAYDNIVAENTQYVALNRVMETAPGEEIEGLNFGAGKNLGSVSETIQKIKGSTKTIRNPYITLLESSGRIIREADRNEVLSTFADFLENDRGLYDGETNQLSSVGAKVDQSKPLPQNTQVIYRNGKKEVWQFDEDIHAALKGLQRTVLFPAWARMPASVLKWGITNMPAFAIRNLMRDTQARFLVTRSSLRDSIRAMKITRRENNLEKLKLGGGDQAGHYTRDQTDYMRALDAATRELASDNNSLLIAPRKFAQFFSNEGPYRRLLEKGEQANRLAEYKASFAEGKRRGYDDYNAHVYAAAQARDLMDFAIAGEHARMLNQIIPFFNAAIQGTKRTVIAAMENPRRFRARFLLFAVLPTIAQRMFIAAMGEDVEDEYEEMPAYLRDMYWNFKVGPDKWLRIPKNFESGVIASFADRAISGARGYDDPFKGYLDSLHNATIPVDGQTLLGPAKPWVEAMANYDQFRDSTIISPFDVGTDLSKRNTEYASRLGKAFQSMAETIGLDKTETGRKYFDARVVDFLFKGTLGNFGDTATRLSNIGREDTNKKIGLRDTGIVVSSPAYAAKSVQGIYKLAERHRLRQNKILNDLDELIGAYFNADKAGATAAGYKSVPAYRDAIGRAIRAEARRIKPILEAEIQKRQN